MSGLLDDLRSALREFRRHPGIALVVVFTLGGAMGVSTSLFAVVNTLWFQPWRVKDAERVVVVRGAVSPAEWQHWAQHTRAFSGLAASRGFGFRRVAGSRRLPVESVSANYFDVLGVSLVLGTDFSKDDDRSDGSGTSAVLSHRTWTTYYDADPEIIGRSIRVDDVPFTVVGVAATSFDGVESVGIRRGLWLPLSAGTRLQPKTARPEPSADLVSVMGRLAPGVSSPQAQAELQASSARFRAERGLPVQQVFVRGTDGYSRSSPSAQAQATFFTLLLAVTFLTLVACANVANLLLARGHARRGEIAVRLSLGATRARLVRRLLVEALLLSMAAGLLGVAVASVLPDHLFAGEPAFGDILRLEFATDHRVFAWALFASVLSCAVFGLMPALQCTRLSVSHVLKDAHGLSAPALRTSLPSLQALVSVLALGVAGLVVRSEPSARARSRARSFEGVVVLRPEYPREYDAARRRRLGSELLSRLQELAGPRNVAAVDGEPVTGEAGALRSLGVSGGYFDVLRIPMLAGRAFQPADPPGQVLIVNRAFAERSWPAENAVGKIVSAGIAPSLAGRQVVGVVGDVGGSTTEAGERVTYVPVSADAVRLVLVRDSDARLKTRLRVLAAAVDPALQTDIQSGSAFVARVSPGSGLFTRVVGEFGAFALVLATLGLFSLSDYAVRQRTREIGVRTALGARPRHVLAAIFLPASRALLNGLTFGTAAAVCLGFVMRRFQLPTGVDPLDVVTYAAVAAILIGAGVVAAYRPARHAMRVQPSEALRYE